jgi:hypothetical protein
MSQFNASTALFFQGWKNTGFIKETSKLQVFHRFSGKTVFLKQACNSKCPYLPVKIDHNATIKYATTTKAA